jgi:16S rRNA (guanine966-N2)-methyltransferase
LSFEALSRDAKFCQLIEANNEAYQNLVINKESLGFTNCDIQLNTAENYLKKNTDQFDIIFFDPPFARPEFSLLLPSLKNYLNEEGLIYYESSRPYADEDFKIIKESRAGQVYFYLLKK